MKVMLIRHGKTEANEHHLYCGSTDLPLSKEGRRELAGLCYEGPNARFATSGMRRTEETLTLLFGDRPHTIIRDFREIDFGAFEMRGYEELKNDPAYQVWLTGDNEKNVPPGGESGEQMKARVLCAWRQLEETKEDWVIITHGGVIGAVMDSLFPEEGKNRYQWQPRPGQGYHLTKTDGSWDYTLLP